MIRILMILAVTATVSLVQTAPAVAQDAGASGRWSLAAGAATDNRSKGLSKTRGDAYAWVAAGWETDSGLFHAESTLQTVKGSGGSNLELIADAGVRPEVAGFDLDLYVTLRLQTDSDPEFDAGAWEVTADVKRSIGPASARLRLQYSPDGIGGAEAWTWSEARVGWDFTHRLTGTAAIGRREQDNSPDYTAWNAGFTYALTRALEADLRYYATDADDIPGEQYADSLVAGITLAF